MRHKFIHIFSIRIKKKNIYLMLHIIVALIIRSIIAACFISANALRVIIYYCCKQALLIGSWACPYQAFVWVPHMKYLWAKQALTQCLEGWLQMKNGWKRFIDILTLNNATYIWITFTWDQFHKKCTWTCPYNVFRYYTRTDSTFAPSQWEKALLCNDVSYWLGASLVSVMLFF